MMIGAKKPKDMAENYLQLFDLEDHRDKKARNLSGGNMRKLCCAQALMGNPAFCVVDEVSAGVDPVARRKIW
jgi:ABC-type multidrug transport system ATPase subunit